MNSQNTAGVAAITTPLYQKGSRSGSTLNAFLTTNNSVSGFFVVMSRLLEERRRIEAALNHVVLQLERAAAREHDRRRAKMGVTASSAGRARAGSPS